MLLFYKTVSNRLTLHFKPCQHTDGMVHVQMVTEVTACFDELSNTHVRRTFAARTSTVEYFPSRPEAIVEHVHRLRHAIICVSILAIEWWQYLCFGGFFFRHLC